MISFITNKNNLEDKDIDIITVRVKALLINSNNEILLAFSHNDYQFPGGKIEENEDLIDALNREVKEETGIKLNLKNEQYFACSIGYWKDHPEVGINKKTIVYYFKIYTDKKPNLENTSYTKAELEGNFTLMYIPLDKVIEKLDENIEKYGDEFGISNEMKKVIKNI